MKSQLRNLLAGLILCLPLLSSCDDKIDLNLDTTSPYLVVDGLIDDDSATRDTVRLSTTIGYLDQATLPPIEGATVILTGSDGTRDTLDEARPGRYVVAEGWRGQIGQTYTLDVVTRDDARFQSVPAAMPRQQVLDSLTVEKRDEDGGVFEPGYYVKLWWLETPGKGDFFMFRVTKNDTLQNLPQELFVIDDAVSDGQYVYGPSINFEPYDEGTVVKVDLVSLTQDAYYFFTELGAQVNNGGLFAQPPANVRTNIRNLDAGSEKRVTGYFLVTSKTGGTIICQ